MKNAVSPTSAVVLSTIVAGLGFLVVDVNAVQATPLVNLPNLQSITFFETSGSNTPYTFTVNSSQLLTKLSALNSTSNDFVGVSTEFYDVFYSDSLGNLDVNGMYVTVESVYDRELPAGGGLNIAEVQLNFTSGTEFANQVTAFTALGNNAIVGSQIKAVDGNLLTTTTLGNTVGQNKRLSLTLGFASTAIPEPSAILSLLALGTLGAASTLKRKLKPSQSNEKETTKVG
ncbi:PEP-CTERM sorting domain-containing protein [Microcystis aeruginosa]|uniref:PEP-CTERM protein-sorting domain-containing protein n=1 Tax=Microcystis aeruginosa NIES-44 TaxID=449439 RepID=A0A0A1VWR0_MICAE|nr:PEP-CTERM sorting domain-containing protein [Microcystis aeruginosa]GAL94180.1 hypothetical protein N44_02760 [Microcystis aeruginosa NIES-44]